MCGIFGYVNYLVERDRKFILETLLTGLSRLEYRGYDSAGIACDGDKEGEVFHHFYHQKRTYSHKSIFNPSHMSSSKWEK
jgi:glucosamine 6-phosphate synthetase-like amidotransferase/phosphosugar isomerase protein